MVLKEVLEDKREYFFQKYKALHDNPICELLGITDLQNPDKLFHSIEEKLLDDHSIPYTITSVNDAKRAFDTACELAVNHKPPFEKQNDKGFKDFDIGWTIKEWHEKKPNDLIVVLTNDIRFIEYLEDSLDVKVAKTIEEFMQLVQSSPTCTVKQDEYKDSIETAHLSSDVIDNLSLTSNLISSLEQSDSFITTRNLIYDLDRIRDEMSFDEKIALLKIALKNDQVRYILHDANIANFFIPFLVECGDNLNVHEADKLVASFKAEPLDDVCARLKVSVPDEYTSFARKFNTSLISVDAGARIESLSFRILPKLKTVISNNKMERRIPFGADVYESFIEPGKFECMSCGFDFDVLESFVDLLERAGWQHRLLMCRSIASQIREVKDRSV